MFSHKRVRPWFNVFLCGITTTNPGINPWIYPNEAFLERVMANAGVDSDRTDDDDMFKDLFGM